MQAIEQQLNSKAIGKDTEWKPAARKHELMTPCTCLGSLP
jgi:hypothetical protein